MARRLYVVAKISKTVYDECVKKNLLVKFAVLFLFIINILLVSPFVLKTYAACSSGTDAKGKTITADMIKNDPKLEATIKKCLTIDTAIGTISTEPQAFVQFIFSFVLGLAGGIALILIIISGYKFMVSGGNPEAVKAATERLTSAVIGLLFIILSFVILQIIGVDILRIPGFNP